MYGQHFEIDLILYNSDIVDYTIVNDSPVGFIDLVYMIKNPMNECKLTFIMQETAPSSGRKLKAPSREVELIADTMA